MSINSIGDSWRSFVTAIQPFAHKNLASVVVAKIQLVWGFGVQHMAREEKQDFQEEGSAGKSSIQYYILYNEIEVNDSKIHRVGIRGSDEERMKARDQSLVLSVRVCLVVSFRVVVLLVESHESIRYANGF